MMINRHIDNLDINDFDYHLPESRIAKYPLKHRDRSKLLIYNKSAISETKFDQLPNFIPPDSLLILNDTKVIHARMIFHRPTGSKIEIFLIEPIFPEVYETSFASKNGVIWKCIVGNLKRWKENNISMPIGNSASRIFARKISTNIETVDIEFTWDDASLSFARIIEICGVVPIPPYLKRESEPEDNERYQTVYAKPEGSVAAPTAGLHFTNGVLKSLLHKNIDVDYITLHVGAGTFKPVKTNKILEHEMHIEHFTIQRETLVKLIKNWSKITAVGTTSLRALESIYWLGVKALNSCLTEPFHINQWEPYELPQDIDIQDAFKALYDVLDKAESNYISATTQILITPGYKVRTANNLITNFHQPKSTLLLLIAAFIGDEWKRVYDYALSNDFRFLSYGDSSLLTKKI